MPEERDNQIERRDSGGISRRSETARRGSDAAGFVRGLANRRTESNLPGPTFSADHTYEFALKWGTEGTRDGQFSELGGIEMAPDGKIYLSDKSNHRIQKFTSEGVFVSKWGTKGDSDGEFQFPQGMAVAPDGSVYVADLGNNRIQKFTSEGVFVTKWGAYGSGDGQFDLPLNVAVSSDGNVYVAEASQRGRNHRIQKFTSEGIFVQKWGTRGGNDGEFYWPTGLTVSSNGSVYVTGLVHHRIQKFTSEGGFVCSWGTWGTGDGEFKNPYSASVASDGSVYVSDTGNNRIQKFTADGVFVTKWGTPDAGYRADRTVFDYRQTDLAVGSDGSIYFADVATVGIQKFTPVS